MKVFHATVVVLSLAFALAGGVSGQAFETRSTGDLFLVADGTLATESSPTQACVTLAGPNPTPATGTFESAALADGSAYDLNSDSVTLTVQLQSSGGGAAQAGTGFELGGSLQVGETEPVVAQPQSFAATQSPSSGTLTFPTGGIGETSGPVRLTVSLTPIQQGLPLAAAHDVQIVCGHANTKLASFTYAVPAASPPGGDEHGEEDEHAPGEVSIMNVAIISLVAAGATMLAGALVLAGRTISSRRIHLLLGATAGLLLAIAILDLIPESFELNEDAPYTIAFGVLGLFAVKWAVGQGSHGHGDHPHDHSHKSDHAHEKKTSSHSATLALIAFLALSFHRFVDGLVLPAAFELDSVVGYTAAAAVLLHQFPDGIAAASVFLAAGWRRVSVLRGVGVMALLTPVGAFAGLFLLGLSGIVGHLVALAAATFIFIALAELLPELQGREHRVVVAVGFGLGYLIAFGLDYVAALLGAGH